MKIDRTRLLEIERLANEVLMEQEDLRGHIRQADTIRQGLRATAPPPKPLLSPAVGARAAEGGSINKSSSSSTSTSFITSSSAGPGATIYENNLWLSTGFEDGGQFVRFGRREAREGLERERIRNERDQREKRAGVKQKLRELYDMHPTAAEIPRGVLDLLCREEQLEKDEKEAKKDNVITNKTARAPAQAQKAEKKEKDEAPTLASNSNSNSTSRATSPASTSAASATANVKSSKASVSTSTSHSSSTPTRVQEAATPAKMNTPTTAASTPVVKRNRLDYSQWNNITTSSSEEDDSN
ncbi:unnamed protein product [Amoebophrya sp. A25]|nr:unnamed protein product [Amoebophrya sp. A25]|eukprot:GSA25T00011147001.1